jgi:phage baseplate assembly protein W
MEEIYGTDLKLRLDSQPDYAGLGADLSVDRNGDYEIVSGRENLGQAILHRLMTRKGELSDIGHPQYGSRLYELIGEPNTERTRELLKLYAKECISQEPRVKDIVRILVSTIEGITDSVMLDITVMPIKSSVPLNLVFPFYLEVA